MTERTMFQLYLEGCGEAIALYGEAFGAAMEAVRRTRRAADFLHPRCPGA